MKFQKKVKKCSNFKPLDEYLSHYKNSPSQNCNNCIYFSSRNCGFDISDNLGNEYDFL